LTKWIIQVVFPDGTSRKFTTNFFQEREGRILFKDKFDQPKNFPYEACFIERVEE